LRATTLTELWCGTLDGAVSASGAAPAVFDDVVVQSALTPLSLYHLTRQMQKMGFVQYVRSLANVIGGNSYHPAGQVVFGLRLSDGGKIWKSREFASAASIRGHSSGTATDGDGIGVVVLPVPDVVWAFDIRSGRELWRTAAVHARGPALVVEQTVFVFGSTGVIRVLNLRDGAVRCSYQSSMRFDRAGPAIAGSLLVISSIEGEVVAIPRRFLEHCQANELLGLLGAGPALPTSIGPH
jgi:outer membrane protein assembly factor BamB